jgi:hypothetical protein
MLRSDETKARGKSRKTGPPRGGDKATQRRLKAAARVPEADQPPSAPEETVAPVALAETAASPSPADTPPIATTTSEETAPVSYRAIADAWGNYSRTSMEQTKVYFEKLAGVRSLGAAFEVQTEFAKQACDTLVAQSQRIGELQGEMAKQRLKRLEGFMEKMTSGARQR